MDYREIITIEPDKLGGKPCIRGLRITVYDVLDYLASGMTEAEILADFPDLRADDLRASLAFAADRERRLLSVPAWIAEDSAGEGATDFDRAWRKSFKTRSADLSQ